jgi:hypothetical protein
MERSNLRTVGDVATISTQELLREPNFGKKSLREVRAAIARFGGYFRDEAPPGVKVAKRIEAAVAESVGPLEPSAPVMADPPCKPVCIPLGRGGWETMWPRDSSGDAAILEALQRAQEARDHLGIYYANLARKVEHIEMATKFK